MNAAVILLSITTAFLNGTEGGAAAPSPSRTQSELNAAASKELRSVEAQMEELLRALAGKAKGHPEAQARLDRAQGAWVKYRDAQLDALWPSDDPSASYGSVHPMCVSVERTALTRERVAQLRLMSDHEEGDVCFSAWPE